MHSKNGEGRTRIHKPHMSCSSVTVLYWVILHLFYNSLLRNLQEQQLVPLKNSIYSVHYIIGITMKRVRKRKQESLISISLVVVLFPACLLCLLLCISQDDGKLKGWKIYNGVCPTTTSFSLWQYQHHYHHHQPDTSHHVSFPTVSFPDNPIHQQNTHVKQ